MGNKKSSRMFIFFSLLPAILIYTVFKVLPVFEVFKLSFYRLSVLSFSEKFVGLHNFRALIHDNNFIRAFQNSVLLIVYVTIITLVLSLMFASILVNLKIKGSSFYRVIFYVPSVLSIVVIGGIFAAIYDSKNGLLVSILGFFGLKGPELGFLGDQSIVIYSIMLVMVWQALGYYMVMYMAAMSSIPKNIYEAAEIDGANSAVKFFNVTIPLIWSSIRTTLSFFIISNINMSFLIATILTGGGPDGASEVFLTYMYNQAYTNQSYGYGMAIGVVVFIFSFVVSAIVSFVTKREVLQY
ncbi:carbohydrate ABC transporter permease [Oceanivirga miroungae]|uniref:Binding-protein-dependent transport system inner membrane protein n=1 Tax=Oceanivirga miroungae TaxID=1130046 RepID=A0A6I8M516_9FUSO|nr:sugar ABC transporter permease [Oceanivirga miroungae]VWL85017.1 binding-protein-dependent transport system inner membrane protein [Oceanivirga miroungae]